MNPSHPSWSPDATKIAFARWKHDDWRLHIMDSNGSNVEPVGDASGLSPAWSPDGEKLVFSDLVDHSVEAIFTVNVDGSEETRIVYDEEWTFYSPDWQPTP